MFSKEGYKKEAARYRRQRQIVPVSPPTAESIYDRPPPPQPRPTLRNGADPEIGFVDVIFWASIVLLLTVPVLLIAFKIMQPTEGCSL